MYDIAVMKLTVSNGLSLQTFISQCMISRNLWFQMGGGSIARYANFLSPMGICALCYIYISERYFVLLCVSVERERDLKW